MSETTLLQQIRLACSRNGTRLFRNNTALAWVGQVVKITVPMSVRVGPGDVVIRNARPLHAGLCEGSSDLIGWTTRDGVAVFTAVETKSPRGRLTDEQANFLRAVADAGGVAIEARSVEEAAQALGVRSLTL